MPSNSMGQVAATLRNKANARGTRADNVAAGRQGEAYVAAWLTHLELEFVDIDNSYGSKMPSLAAAGGKRPDFIVRLDGWLLFLDSKHHTIGAGGEFFVDDAELAQQHATLGWFRREFPDETDIVSAFIVVRRGTGGKAIYVVGLDEAAAGTRTNQFRKDGFFVPLDGREALWRADQASPRTPTA